MRNTMPSKTENVAELLHIGESLILLYFLCERNILLGGGSRLLPHAVLQPACARGWMDECMKAAVRTVCSYGTLP